MVETKKHKILLVGSHGTFPKLKQECIDYLEEHGLHYPKCMGYENRTNPVLIDMFNKFSEPIRPDSDYRILKGVDYENINMYWVIREFEGDVYTISEYDGKESVQTMNDFTWYKVNN